MSFVQQSATPRAEIRTRNALPEIRVGPGRIADYLTATPIAIQDGSNRVKYLDLYHWAEPLSKGISRSLAENLARRLHLAHVTVYPDPILDSSGLAVHYTVDRFEGTLAGPVTLEVSWEIVQRPSNKVIAGARSVYVVSANSHETDVAAYVNRLAAAVEEWSDDIAAAIRSPGSAR